MMRLSAFSITGFSIGVTNMFFLPALMFMVWAGFTDCEKPPYPQLRDDLMTNYGNVFIRPVKDSGTATVVSVRPLFNRLVEMDMKQQYFIMDTWMKLIWIDEYLRWEPSDYNGTNEIYLPADAICTPDITFYENVDLSFQRFKPDTQVSVTSDGKLTWFVPSMFVSGCSIRVKWFPYDIQVCDMTFGSFSYSGKDIIFVPGKGSDANQNRYLENGVWDMVATNRKQIITKFECCEYPFYEVQYRLIFKRRPEFYMRYLIIPVFLLSVLSIMVFYLPPDSGEKITLCITNLLALIVFQQVITENMPPSGAESPVIGSFFLSMIIIVGASVIATIAVIHMNSTTHRPTPRWVRWLILRKMSRLVCLEAVKISHQPCGRDTNTEWAVKTFADFDDQLKKEQKIRHDWKLVSLVCDRYLMVIFSMTTVVITVTLLVTIVIGSEQEFEEEIEILNNSWKRDTERFL